MPNITRYSEEVEKKALEILRNHPQKKQIVDRANTLAVERYKLDTSRPLTKNLEDYAVAALLIESEGKEESSKEKEPKPPINTLNSLGGLFGGAGLCTILAAALCPSIVFVPVWLFAGFITLLFVAGLCMLHEARKLEVEYEQEQEG
jgi:hypothetical protein